MRSVEQIIEDYVRLNNKVYGENTTYIECVGDMNKIDLQIITEQDVGLVIKRFLIKWGKMQRVINEKKAPEWKNGLAELIQANSQRLNDLKTVDLSDVELSRLESDIKELYESFKEALGGTGVGAAKVLHLISPSFFTPWDNAISNAVRNEDIPIKTNVSSVKLSGKYYQEHRQQIEEFLKKYKSKKIKKPKPLSATDYYCFMQKIQAFIRKHEHVLSNLASEYKKSKIKIVDDFLWYLTQRPLLALSFLEHNV